MEQPIKAIRCGKILTPRRVINKGVILTQGRKIKALLEEERLTIPPEASIFDLGELTTLPGLIDVHMHGWGGYDFSSHDVESLEKVSSLLPSLGVTTYLLTICNVSKEDMLGVIGRAADFMSAQTAGARAAGLHLEGPFLNPLRKGAMRADTLLKPDLHLLEIYLNCGRGHIKMMTLSPELEGALDIISRLDAAGIVPCAGHSEADYSQARTAISKGVRHAVHTFNAMGPFHHRAPGLVGAVLTDEAITAEVIPDGVHTHPAAVKLLFRAKGEAGVVTVSDAHPMAGMRPGNYKDGTGREVLVAEDAVRLADRTLVGGATPLNRLVRNLAEYGGTSLREAVTSATLNPARLMGIDGEVGSLETGKDADLTAVDADFNVRLTMVKGEIAFRTED